MKIWTNAEFAGDVTDMFYAGVSNHQVLVAERTSALNLVNAPPDQRLSEADIAFGQPDANQLRLLTRLKWVHLTTAGYTAYDRDDLRSALQSRDIALTTSSGVYDEPCAQHTLAMMMAFARQLPQSLLDQHNAREWPAAVRRKNSFLLNGQCVLLCGYGSIANRLSELLRPFGMQIVGVRRNPTGKESVPTVAISKLNNLLPEADHVVNLLPSNATSNKIFGNEQFQCMKPTSYFYNVGRGSTVDERALESALDSHQIAGAYLDVTAVEPLPKEHALWDQPNCYVTPHSAGGFRGEMQRLVTHFLENLRRFEAKEQLLNRVI